MTDNIDYLKLAKGLLDDLRDRQSTTPGANLRQYVYEAGMLAVQIAQVEALEEANRLHRLDMIRYDKSHPWQPTNPLPFEEDQREKCVHDAYIGEDCEACALVADIGACVHGGQDDGCAACADLLPDECDTGAKNVLHRIADKIENIRD